MTFPQPDNAADLAPLRWLRPSPGPSFRPQASSAPESRFSPVQAAALRTKLEAQIQEYNEDVLESGEPQISRAVANEVVRLAHFAMAECFEGPRPSVFGGKAGSAVLVFQNRPYRRRVSVEVSPDARRYRVTCTDLAHGPGDSDDRAADPRAIRAELHWVAGLV